MVGSIPDEATVTSWWEEELRRRIFGEAMRGLREGTEFSERTIEVFDRVAIRDVSPTLVAEEFGLSTEEVYRVKYRVTKRLRSIVAELTEAYTSEG